MHDFNSLRKCIKINSQGVETVVLDLIDWSEAEHFHFFQLRWGPQEVVNYRYNFFSRNVLEIYPGRVENLLPSLRSLSLSAVSFRWAVKEMQHALNITQLRSLSCPYSLPLLDTIVKEAQTIRLISFELVIDIDCRDHQTYNGRDHNVKISAFLNAFRGLEDLYLMVTDEFNWELVAQAILGRLSTLNRLITHGRTAFFQLHSVKRLSGFMGQCNAGSIPKHGSDVYRFMPRITGLRTCRYKGFLAKDLKDVRRQSN